MTDHIISATVQITENRCCHVRICISALNGKTLTHINNDDNNMLCHVIGEVNARTTTTITTMVKQEMK